MISGRNRMPKWTVASRASSRAGDTADDIATASLSGAAGLAPIDGPLEVAAARAAVRLG